MIAAFLWHWFDFPNGGVLQNLVASGICVLFAAWRIFVKLNVIHKHAEAAHMHAKAAHDHVLKNVPVRKPATRKSASS